MLLSRLVRGVLGRHRSIVVVLLTVAAPPHTVVTQAARDAAVSFPERYREWAQVKGGLVSAADRSSISSAAVTKRASKPFWMAR